MLIDFLKKASNLMKDKHFIDSYFLNLHNEPLLGALIWN